MGEVASYFPSPGTVANLLRKGGQRGLREGGEEAADQTKETIRGIGPDEAVNGVYLPPGTHRKTFGNDYFKALDERLEAIDEASPTAKQDAIRELNKIGREIERGQFP